MPPAALSCAGTGRRLGLCSPGSRSFLGANRPTAVYLGRTARRAVCPPVCAKKKGSATQQPGVKVSSRGKVSSRPGMVSPKKSRDAADPQQQELDQQPILTSQDVPTTQQQPSQQQQQQQPRDAAAPSEAPRRQQSIAETPQVVVDRMFKRILLCAGTPVVTGLLLFPLFWYLKVVQKVEYPFWLVYVTQAIMFGGGLLGITYGVMSTSWDPRREGSALGWTEFQANLPILLKRGDR